MSAPQQTKAEKKAAAAAEKAEKDRVKLVKLCTKEGGKKGQDLEGMADLGGVHFFHVALEYAAGEHALVANAMEGANKEVDPEGDDRKGGAGALGKAFFSCSDDLLVCHMHVPKALQEKLTINEWYECLNKALGGTAEIVAETDETRNFEVKANPEKNIFPLKIRDTAINQGFELLVSKQLVPDQGSSDDECYLPDDW